MDLRAFLQQGAVAGLVPWSVQVEAAERSGLSLAVVERRMLEAGLLPARYQRNRQMLAVEEQLRLSRSRVVVLGCGGLGGYILEELARLGVGHLVAVDPDVFEEHNCNRQLLAGPSQLGRSKVAAAAERIRQVNPAVVLTPVQEAFGRENGESLLVGAQAAVDGLDCNGARLELAECCAALAVPLVHGAIAGWYGQVATQLPGERTLQRLFAEKGAKGIEKEMGNPSFTPALLASLEVAEVCKVLLGRGAPLCGRLLHVDLLEMEFVETAL